MLTLFLLVFLALAAALAFVRRRCTYLLCIVGNSDILCLCLSLSFYRRFYLLRLVISALFLGLLGFYPLLGLLLLQIFGSLGLFIKLKV